MTVISGQPIDFHPTNTDLETGEEESKAQVQVSFLGQLVPPAQVHATAETEGHEGEIYSMNETYEDINDVIISDRLHQQEPPNIQEQLQLQSERKSESTA